MFNSSTTLIKCIQKGYQQPSLITPKRAGEYIDELLSYFLTIQIQNRLPQTETLLLNWSANMREQGLIATRQGDLDTAAECFAKARTYYELGSFSLEGNLLYKSFQEPAEAYLNYVCQDFDQGRHRIYVALNSDVELELAYGYDVLFIHRLHLVLNIVRLEARRNCFTSAMELACQLLSYLQGTSEGLSLPFPWGVERMASLTEDVIILMGRQVLDEIALMFAGKNLLVVEELLAIVTSYLPTANKLFLFPQVQEWLLIKQAFLQGDVPGFLERIAEFLAKGRGNTPLLWYAVLIDLLSFWDKHQLPEAELIHEEVYTRVMDSQKLPRKLIPLFRLYIPFELEG